MAQRKKRKDKGAGGVRMLPVLHPDAAGIDIGAEEVFVAVSPDRAAEPVRSFETFTRDLHEMADWLQSCGVRSVAMESTGVFWIPVFQILETRGFEVFLVNAQHVRNVPGRKSDVSDCQWIQYLHAVGLLKASFRPPDQICVVRSLWRHRESLVQMAAEHTMHMQKALSQMNLQLHHVLSDITGLSGMRILDAILAGERDPVKLAALCHGTVRSPRATVAKSLEGDYGQNTCSLSGTRLLDFASIRSLFVRSTRNLKPRCDRSHAQKARRTRCHPVQRSASTRKLGTSLLSTSKLSCFGSLVST
jgi:transposase